MPSDWKARRSTWLVAVAWSIVLLTAGSHTAAASETDDRGVLERHNWTLLEAHSSTGLPLPVFTPANADPMTLRFSGGSLDASGCNSLGQNYTLADRRIVQLKEDGNLVTRTLLGCGSPRAEADDAMLALLNGNPRYQLVPAGSQDEGPQLVLESDAGEIVSFGGKLTASARFGSEGETIYFDIAPGTIRCALPGRPTRDCFQVRQLSSPTHGSYSPGNDEVPAGQAGPWQILYEGIEGLSVEDVSAKGLYLPIRRFQRPAGSSTPYAYVLFGL